ncbi:GNAT family N-acetyltransferase [uncultured Aliiroseovarius sp.]|uniref:GNAT family N-acetyltransferase n=1 Tax=uncultured Aliiroseovarius sp. TaxID=1658783 RepID=UPI0025946289|nr:GNAT family N-acetyltransferase [uncultured Aliiroseovarius sp.]
MRNNYIQNPDNVRCSVAEDEVGRMVRFQSLILPKINIPYGTPDGWGEIGAYVARVAGRRGIGPLLFADSVATARDAAIRKIEASIGRDNPLGIAYYEAMGFKTHELTDTLDRKCFVVSQ